MPELFIIAGPNGAGKTTAASTILPEILNITEFVNADEIAKGLSPFNPEGVAFEAGRIMLKRINQLIKEKKDFAFETTLSAKSYIQLLKSAIKDGYVVSLIFFWLNSLEIAKNRVAERVLLGGHNIPEDIIERRYHRGIINLPLFLETVTNWYVYDNSKGEYEQVAKSLNNEKKIINFEVWQKVLT